MRRFVYVLRYQFFSSYVHFSNTIYSYWMRWSIRIGKEWVLVLVNFVIFEMYLYRQSSIFIYIHNLVRILSMNYTWNLISISANDKPLKVLI